MNNQFVYVSVSLIIGHNGFSALEAALPLWMQEKSHAGVLQTGIFECDGNDNRIGNRVIRICDCDYCNTLE